VVHFPIALLLFAAVFVLLAAITPIRGWWFSVSALLLLIGGTVSAFVSVSTGEAAMNVAEGDGENDDKMYEVLDEHQAKMEQVSKYFAALTAVYAGLVFLPLLFKSLRGLKFAFPANLIFLAALMGANLLLANGAHLGGRLVHEFGVRSTLAPERGGEATEDTEAAGEAQSEAAEPGAESEAAPAAEAEQESAGMTEEAETPATTSAPAQAAPAEEAKPETSVEEPKTETPAIEAAKEAPAAEPKADAPAAEPAQDTAGS